jgi:hypothetical protein
MNKFFVKNVPCRRQIKITEKILLKRINKKVDRSHEVRTLNTDSVQVDAAGTGPSPLARRSLAIALSPTERRS